MIDIKNIITENTPLLKDIDISLSEKLTYFSKLNINYIKKITDINKAKETYMIELNNFKLRHCLVVNRVRLKKTKKYKIFLFFR